MAGGNVAEGAKLAKRNRSDFYKLIKYNIDVEEFSLNNQFIGRMKHAVIDCVFRCQGRCYIEMHYICFVVGQNIEQTYTKSKVNGWATKTACIWIAIWQLTT